MVNTMVAGVAAIVITVVFGWQLGLAIIGCTPILVAAGAVSVKLHTGDRKKDTIQAEKAGNVRSAVGELKRAVV